MINDIVLKIYTISVYKYTELGFLEKMAVNVYQEVFFFVHDSVNKIPMHNVMNMKYIYIYSTINLSYFYDFRVLYLYIF